MDYEKLNSVLKDLSTFRYQNKPIDRKVNYEVDGYGEQGESNDIDEVYDIGLKDGFFLKINIGSDSYGSHEFVRGLQFVKPKEKIVTIYEY